MATSDDSDTPFPALPPLRQSAAGEESRDPQSSWSSSFLARSHSSTTPRSRQSSPRPFSPSSSLRVGSRLSSSGASPFGGTGWKKLASALGSIRESFSGKSPGRQKGPYWSKRKKVGGWRSWPRRIGRGVMVWAGLVGFFFLMNWWMFAHLQDPKSSGLKDGDQIGNAIAPLKRLAILGKWTKYEKDKRPHKLMFTRLLGLAAHALAETEKKPEPQDLWEEPLIPALSWTPCADQRSWGACEGNNGYILVSANGGINQQRVAICNAVAIARLLNSTLVLPQFLFNSVWKDESQFSDIYQEEHFINYLKPDIRIVKELPVELRSLDLEAIGSLVTDVQVMKEAKLSFYLKKILPILLKNRVVHFIGFGNRLTFDPIPFDLQRLRCRCNFHALQFVDKIQETGALLVQRICRHSSHQGPLEHNLFGPFVVRSAVDEQKKLPKRASRFLAVHLRFEIDMAAYSLCYFGGGKEEEEELEAYRSVHFPALTLLRKTPKMPSASFLRSEGKCPLTPEESVLMLAALGFKRKTSIYIAGAHIYGGKSRMAALTNLYPNLATKESLLSSSEIEPFRNFSSQLAALDFIVCAVADAFAITDSGSQLSSLVSGYRMYYGGGRLPTIRPNKRRLASIFSKNSTIEWKEFEKSVRKAVKQTKNVQERPIARSVYRHPRCLECMCHVE